MRRSTERANQTVAEVWAPSQSSAGRMSGSRRSSIGWLAAILPSFTINLASRAIVFPLQALAARDRLMSGIPAESVARVRRS